MLLNAARRQTLRTYERVCAVLLNHCQLQLLYLTGFTFLNQCISHKENNMLKLWDKSEKDIDNHIIIFTCIGALQTGLSN